MEPTVADLPFDPVTRDIVCRRDGERRSGRYTLHFNISQQVVHHSPCGFEWGYQGSGPADYALNILHLFLPPHQHTYPCYHRQNDGSVVLGCEIENIRLFKGECSRPAFRLHQSFKRDFVASLPDEGGTIHGRDIRLWIAGHAVEDGEVFIRLIDGDDQAAAAQGGEHVARYDQAAEELRPGEDRLSGPA